MHITGNNKKFKDAVVAIDVLYGTEREKEYSGMEKDKEKEKDKDKERDKDDNNNNSKTLSNLFSKQMSFPRPISLEKGRSHTDDMTWQGGIEREKEKEKDREKEREKERERERDRDRDKEPKKLSSRIAQRFGMSNSGGG